MRACTLLHTISCCDLFEFSSFERERQKSKRKKNNNNHHHIIYFIVNITFYCTCVLPMFTSFVRSFVHFVRLFFKQKTNTIYIPLFHINFKWLCTFLSISHSFARISYRRRVYKCIAMQYNDKRRTANARMQWAFWKNDGKYSNISASNWAQWTVLCMRKRMCFSISIWFCNKYVHVQRTQTHMHTRHVNVVEIGEV